MMIQNIQICNLIFAKKNFRRSLMMLMQRAIGIFSTYEVAETALRELKSHGFMMERVSVIGNDINHQPDVARVNTGVQSTDFHQMNNDHNESGEGAKKGAIAGSTVGGLTGLLVGLGAIAIPGVGPVMLAGAAATAIATAISGSVVGAVAGSLTGGLVGLQVPEDRARVYSDQVAQGNYLVIVEGSASEIDVAKSIFSKHHIHEWHVYDLPSESVPTTTSNVYHNT
jgi:hypothetical protein